MTDENGVAALEMKRGESVDLTGPWQRHGADWDAAVIRSSDSRSSSPQLTKSPLLPRGGQVFLARLVVKQVDDDVPHGRTPLFDPRMLIPGDCFRASSRARKNGFVGTTELFRRHGRVKPLHGTASGNPVYPARASAKSFGWTRPTVRAAKLASRSNAP